MATAGRFFSDPGTSYFLFGPRGTGKSTWLGQQYPDAILIDLLDPETQRRYLGRPQRLRQIVAAQPEKKVVVIDEVQKAQKAPTVLDVVHQLIERDGSRKLKRGGVDLLAGRALNRSMTRFLAAGLPMFRIGSASCSLPGGTRNLRARGGGLWNRFAKWLEMHGRSSKISKSRRSRRSVMCAPRHAA